MYSKLGSMIFLLEICFGRKYICLKGLFDFVKAASNSGAKRPRLARCTFKRIETKGLIIKPLFLHKLFWPRKQSLLKGLLSFMVRVKVKCNSRLVLNWEVCGPLDCCFEKKYNYKDISANYHRIWYEVVRLIGSGEKRIYEYIKELAGSKGNHLF